MYFNAFIALGLLVAASVAGADEKLLVLRVGSEVYSNVTVTTITATDIYFTHANGMDNLKLRKLDPALQRHFQYNPAKAEELEQKQAAANIQYRIKIFRQPEIRPPDEQREVQPSPAAPAGTVSWGTDLPAALNQARADDKMVLLDFTGSDWCPWCIKFDRDVLSTDRFAGYARASLVLVRVDFPRHTPQDEALRQANHELAKQYQVDGYPTYVVLNASGKEIGRQVGYAEGGPEAFIAKLEGFGK